MLNCKFCGKKVKESTTTNLNKEFKSHIEKNNLKYFICDCKSEWTEVDANKEIFDLELFNKNIRSFKDFEELINEIEKNKNNDVIIHQINDCLHRINDWLTRDGDVESLINDDYTTMQIKILKKISDLYTEAV